MTDALDQTPPPAWMRESAPDGRETLDYADNGSRKTAQVSGGSGRRAAERCDDHHREGDGREGGETGRVHKRIPLDSRYGGSQGKSRSEKNSSLALDTGINFTTINDDENAGAGLQPPPAGPAEKERAMSTVHAQSALINPETIDDSNVILLDVETGWLDGPKYDRGHQRVCRIDVEDLLGPRFYRAFVEGTFDTHEDIDYQTDRDVTRLIPNQARPLVTRIIDGREVDVTDSLSCIEYDDLGNDLLDYLHSWTDDLSRENEMQIIDEQFGGGR